MAQTGPQAGGTSGKIMGALQDAIALVRDPRAFMTSRATAAPPMQSTVINYVAILAAIPFFFTLIGNLIFHKGHVIVYSIVSGIVAYIFALASVLIVSYVLFMLAPRFASAADLNKATKMVSYVYTPTFLIAVLNIYPPLQILSFLALLYGLYILWIGLPIVLNTPPEKKLMYVIATLVVTFIVYFILALIAAGLARA